MATIRKRTLRSGLSRWSVEYTDGGGKRRSKLFARKADGEAWLIETGHDLKHGTHTPSSVSPTVAEAAAFWIARCETKRLEPSTVDPYRQHVDLHIVPFIGARKLADLNVPAVHAFADELAEADRSPDMVKRVIRSLGAIFKEARRRGLSAVAPTVGLDLALPERDDPRPTIPSKAELQAIIAGATGRWRPLILVAIFCGLRASELRGLKWADVDFEARTVTVRQRADSSHRIGKLKSKSAYRTLRMPPMVLNSLREWRVACPKGDLDLVFPNGLGRVESYANVMQRGFEPIQIAAGITKPKEILDDDGKRVTITAAKYGLHALRHACASLWIERGDNAKKIQVLMGHSTIKLTYDTYGHLFADDEADQRAAEDVEFRLLGK